MFPVYKLEVFSKFAISNLKSVSIVLGGMDDFGLSHAYWFFNSAYHQFSTSRKKDQQAL